MKIFLENKIKEVKEQIGDKKAILALSGGVDSTVCAALVHEAIGDNLTCVFVDHGLLRKGEKKSVEEDFAKAFGIKLITVDAKDRFLGKLKGINDPETKRKIIGEEFIRVFEEEQAKLSSDYSYLVQGTIYPDIAESGKDGEKLVKSHHNVGGLPEDINFELVEPLRELYKDQVREIGLLLGLPENMVFRQPFPGPGLGVRVLGEITEEKLDILKDADYIYREEIKNAGLERAIWQYFAVIPDFKAVGMVNGERLYSHCIILRAVDSVDATTATWHQIPYEVLDKISKRITEEVPGVVRVLFDITNKPVGTIEFE